MTAGLIGCMTTPAQRIAPPDGAAWAADSGVFGKGYPGDDGYRAWLESRTWDRDRCLFATAPDVVGDAAATLERSAPWLPVIRGLGYRVAYVAQDGTEDVGVPWDDVGALFVGGSTAWKLSPHARAVVDEARARGLWTHMGRVNGWRRWQVADAWGCDSVDGTLLAFGPDLYLPRVTTWSAQDGLW